jgi:carboxyl-terminal processing protease
MSRKVRLVIILVSVPVIALTAVGGFFGQSIVRKDTYRHLRIFEDVASLIGSNYVEDVDLGNVMQGALRGLAESLDSDSAFLSVDDVRWIESGAPLPEGELGIDVTSQYYLQVVAARPNSPASLAGLVSGDFIQAIDGKTTRRLSALEGNRRLRGEPGTSVNLSVFRGNRSEPYDFELTRKRLTDGAIVTQMLDENLGYVRVTRFSAGASNELAAAIAKLLNRGANALLVDVRSTAGGLFEEGIAAARLFVGSGTLLRRTEHGDQDVDVSATAGNEAIDTPLVILTNFGTAHAAEVFVAGLSGANRADIVGQRTAGRASIQKLIKLPDGTGLWLSWARYIQASGDPVHQSGIEPTVAVEVPVVELGEPVPSDDVILKKGLEHLRSIIL